jgi:hypothetical protein
MIAHIATAANAAKWRIGRVVVVVMLLLLTGQLSADLLGVTSGGWDRHSVRRRLDWSRLAAWCVL